MAEFITMLCNIDPNQRRGWALALMLSIGLLLPHATRADTPMPELKPAYRLGILPYLPALTIDRLYSSIAETFSLELHRLVKLRTKTTFENFEDAIATQTYDIIFVHPFFLVDAVDRYDYVPLARLQKPLTAILVVSDDSPVRGLNDLAGGIVGLPPKLAAVSDLLKAAFIGAKLRPGLDVGIRHFRNKASCLQAVFTGAVAACGVPRFVLSQIDAFQRMPLRVVFESPAVSHFAFAALRRVPESERRKLQTLILNWSNSSEGRKLLREAGLDQGFTMVQPGDYAAIRDHKARLQTLAQR